MGNESNAPAPGAHGKLKVINLYGAPGMGKSATRSGLFWLMKVKGMSVEEVSEYAKYLVLSNRTWQLERDQLYVIAKQHHKMLIISGQYDFAVTDSPLMITSYYAPPPPMTPLSFHPMCEEYAASFENINFFLTRDLRAEGSKFELEGRIHDRSDSLRIEMEQKEFLAKRGFTWTDVALDHKSPWTILESVSAMYPGVVPRGGPAEPELLPAETPAQG